MQDNDYYEFVVYLNATAEMLSNGRVLSPKAIAMWWNLMKGYDLDAIRAAFDAHMRNPDTGQYMAKPADVVKMIDGRTEDSALNAWTKVDYAVRIVGPWRDLCFDDPLIHRVLVEMGGWVAVCDSDADEWPFISKEFVTRYRGYKIRNVQPPFEPVMIGSATPQNLRLGMRVEQPVLIGDPVRAAQVRESVPVEPMVRLTRTAPPLLGPWTRVGPPPQLGN